MKVIWLSRACWAATVFVLTSLIGSNFYLADHSIEIGSLPSTGKDSSGEAPSGITGNVLLPDPQKLQQTRLHPLFSPTRREFIPVVSSKAIEAKQPAPSRSDTKLAQGPAVTFQGTRLIGTEWRALVQAEAPSKPEWLPVGSLVGNWTISEIGGNHLVLTMHGQSQTLKLWNKN